MSSAGDAPDPGAGTMKKSDSQAVQKVLGMTELKGHSKSVEAMDSIMLGPTSAIVLSSSTDGTARLWHVRGSATDAVAAASSSLVSSASSSASKEADIETVALSCCLVSASRRRSRKASGSGPAQPDLDPDASEDPCSACILAARRDSKCNELELLVCIAQGAAIRLFETGWAIHPGGDGGDGRSASIWSVTPAGTVAAAASGKPAPRKPSLLRKNPVSELVQRGESASMGWHRAKSPFSDEVGCLSGMPTRIDLGENKSCEAVGGTGLESSHGLMWAGSDDGCIALLAVDLAPGGSWALRVAASLPTAHENMVSGMQGYWTAAAERSRSSIARAILPRGVGSAPKMDKASDVSIGIACVSAAMDGAVRVWQLQLQEIKQKGPQSLKIVRADGGDIGKASGKAGILSAGAAMLNPPLPHAMCKCSEAVDAGGNASAVVLIAAGDGTAAEFGITCTCGELTDSDESELSLQSLRRLAGGHNGACCGVADVDMMHSTDFPDDDDDDDTVSMASGD